MKKILTVLAMVLVIVGIVFVCTSCGKKEEAKAESIQINIKVVNQTGEAIKEVKLEETIGSKQVWEMGKIAADSESSLSINTVVENGSPNVVATFTTESGQGYQSIIDTKGDKTITLKADPNGGITVEVTGK